MAPHLPSFIPTNPQDGDDVATIPGGPSQLSRMEGAQHVFCAPPPTPGEPNPIASPGARQHQHRMPTSHCCSHWKSWCGMKLMISKSPYTHGQKVWGSMILALGAQWWAHGRAHRDHPVPVNNPVVSPLIHPCVGPELCSPEAAQKTTLKYFCT